MLNSMDAFFLPAAAFFDTLYICAPAPFAYGSLRSVVANVLDCDIVVRVFQLQLRYYIHFLTNTLGKGMNLLIPLLYIK